MRFGFAMLVLAALVVVVTSVLVSHVRDGEWTGAAVSGGLLLALLAVGIYSTIQKRRGY